MDQTRFDGISKLFAQRRLSRRQAMRQGAAGLVAAGLTSAGLKVAAAQDATPIHRRLPRRVHQLHVRADEPRRRRHRGDLPELEQFQCEYCPSLDQWTAMCNNGHLGSDCTGNCVAYQADWKCGSDRYVSSRGLAAYRDFAPRVQSARRASPSSQA